MLWYGKENGAAYLYGTAPVRRQRKTLWQAVRIPMEGRLWLSDWERAGCIPDRETREEAEEALRVYGLAHGWRLGDCCGCWHLRENEGACGFFHARVERVCLGYAEEAVRCKQCLAWGEMPPG